MDALKGLVTNELLGAASKQLGESESGISKAMGGILPTVLGGLLNSNSANSSMIGDLLGKAGGNGNFVTDLIGGLGTSGQAPKESASGIGSSLISGIFGDKIGGIANLVSNFAGIKSSSSNSLLGIGGSLIASFLGKKMLGEGLNFSGIMNWLGGHKNEIQSAIPSGIGSFLMDGGSSSSSSAASKSSHTTPASNNDDNGGGMKWLMPLILLGLLGVGIWWFLKGCNNEKAEEVKTEITDAGNSISDAAGDAANAVANDVDSAAGAVKAAVAGTLDEAGNWIATKGEAIKIKLDNGVEIDATKGSLEDKFHAFIKDPNAVGGKDVWFNFEDLLFETGKSTLKAGSEKQLENTVAILKAYPNVKIKLGGYTDNTGDSVANVKLSDSRAKTVYNQMLAKGADKASFNEKPYEGFGPQFPVGDNATAEGRAQNRRISISVRAK